ncbi:outer membrane lipid asymmetry maintenance protein MlaD [Succinivibrio dextrinosolvens]|jgi:phospholipid/cholesterol/gamma-HCH transport system substrate-binding protein|uniref:outer membrane lipid asymmetry maintenance protein MlaD n=1 Tax=Succinivibrio dextrinosolvens TaxID=83771 RepID=UPI002479E0FC|nr:outer membrane lipid asymmetry maintenance protein MlaD [Succinivibrio dextrinosolvens]
MKYLKTEIMVGIFMLLGIIAACVLALQVAGLVLNSKAELYTVYAKFENIGSLRLRAPVRIGGVAIGRVTAINLDNDSLTPVVSIGIEKKFDKISSESKASIQTSGIIGEQYIAITPGFYDEDLGTTYLKDGDSIADTGSAVILEDLISKFVFNSSQDPSKADESAKSSDTELTKE